MQHIMQHIMQRIMHMQHIMQRIMQHIKCNIICHLLWHPATIITIPYQRPLFPFGRRKCYTMYSEVHSITYYVTL